MFKRVFLVVMDSVGVGCTEDSDKYGDQGANTLLHTICDAYNLDVLEKLGLTNLVGMNEDNVKALYMKAKPLNVAKDTLNGHYEIMGAVAKVPYKTYPDGFPLELISKIQHAIGREVIGNCVASGTQIIEDLGEMHMKTGAIIVYTSADSVLQIAAHEDIIPVDELYKICETVRELTKGDEYKIARVIARPFVGKPGNFTRTPRRHDYALDPPINVLEFKYKDTDKISDIFNNKSIAVKVRIRDNMDGIMKLIDFAKGDFKGFLFANLNDFDMLYGHRRDRVGYLKALEEFNYYLPIFLKNLKKDDLFILTADHGNDPTWHGTDHTREYIPIMIYSPSFKYGKRLEDRNTFADIGATILDNFGIKNELGIGTSIFDEVKKEEL